MSKTKGPGSTYSFLDYVRMHPENFFREVGNGLGYDDCIYQMLQIIVDNSIDEFRCGHGNRIELTVDFDSGKMSVRDDGYGAPVSKLHECFGLHAVGGMYTADAANAASMLISCAKIVNGLSSHFRARSVRDGEYGEVEFAEGKLVSNETGTSGPDEKSGTLVEWIPDGTILPKYTVVENHVIRRIRNCAAANPGMAFFFNGRAIDAVEPKSDAIEHGSRNI